MSVAIGDHDTLLIDYFVQLLKDNFIAVACGDNAYGQLGYSSTDYFQNN